MQPDQLYVSFPALSILILAPAFPRGTGCSMCPVLTAAGFFPSLLLPNSPPHHYSLSGTELGLAELGSAGTGLCGAMALPLTDLLAHDLLPCGTCSLPQLPAQLWDVLLEYLLCSEGRDFVMFYSASFGRSSDLSSPYISASPSLATSPTAIGSSTSLGTPWQPVSCCPTSLGVNTPASACHSTR